MNDKEILFLENLIVENLSFLGKRKQSLQSTKGRSCTWSQRLLSLSSLLHPIRWNLNLICFSEYSQFLILSTPFYISHLKVVNNNPSDTLIPLKCVDKPAHARSKSPPFDLIDLYEVLLTNEGRLVCSLLGNTCQSPKVRPLLDNTQSQRVLNIDVCFTRLDW